MNITIENTLNWEETIYRIFNCRNFTGRMSFELGEAVEILEDKLKKYNKEREKVLKKYCTIVGIGLTGKNKYETPDGKTPKSKIKRINLNNEIGDLLSVNYDIDFGSITLEKIKDLDISLSEKNGEGLGLSGVDYRNLKEIFGSDEKNKPGKIKEVIINKTKSYGFSEPTDEENPINADDIKKENQEYAAKEV